MEGGREEEEEEDEIEMLAEYESFLQISVPAKVYFRFRITAKAYVHF